MWKELIGQLHRDLQFFPPATAATIADAEKQLAISFPDDLRALLQESNGVIGPIGLGLVWPVEEIVRTNQEFRSDEEFRGLYAEFDQLLFFADSGTGDQFAYKIDAGIISDIGIFEWNHEHDSRISIARSLERYIGQTLQAYS